MKSSANKIQVTSFQDLFQTGVNADPKMLIYAGMECHFSPVSMRWVCGLDYPRPAGLKPVKS